MSNQNGNSKSIQSFRDFARRDDIVERFAEVVGNNNARAYISSVVLAVANSPALQKCSPVSLISAALQAASLRLSCDPQMRQAYLVPFKGKAVLIVGYKGLYDMAVRTGKYRYIHIHPLHGEQTVEFDPISGAPEIVGHGGVMEEITGWMASFQMYDGFSKTIYMSKAEIHAHAEQYSAGYTRKDGAWQTHPEAMEKKTILRRLLNQWGYLDPNDAQLLGEMEEDREFIPLEDWEPDDDAIEGDAVDSEKDADELIEELGY